MKMLVLPNESMVIWDIFWETNKTLVYKFVIKRIQVAMHQNLDHADLFSFEGSRGKASIKKQNFLSVLEDALAEFVKNEEFENAAKAQKIINEFYINKLIAESAPS
jgi:hypothetical protein